MGTEPAGSVSYLEKIEILVTRRSIGLRAPELVFEADTARPPRSLEAEAMRWTYVLRARQRWLGKGGASQAHEADAVRTLMDFGLTEADLELIAAHERVVVRMPYSAEREGWAGRIFPWEYVIASATRQFRRLGRRRLTVMRELVTGRDTPSWKGTPGQRCLLYVQSAPGGLRSRWDFESESRRVRLDQPDLGGMRRIVLKDPHWEQLRDVIAAERPDLIHLSGFDNVQGLRALRDVAGAAEPVATETGSRTVQDLLAEERGVPDGMLLAGQSARAEVVSAHRLAEALGAGGQHCAYFVGISVDNSAARTAALIVAERAALSAVGFQDEIDNTLADYFFDLVYTQLDSQPWNLPRAFEQAWLRVREEPNAARATGIALWAGAPLIAPPRSEEPKLEPAQLRRDDQPPRIVAQPERELNYAVLHNNGSPFESFVVERGNAGDQDWLSVDVELQLGAEHACYRKRFQARQDFFDLKDDITLPLTSSLMRSSREAVTSAVTVQIACNDHPLARDTYRLRLLPVDQWRDNERDGQWLPSFVLPRDPAVAHVVEKAQRFVRVLRDNPIAGFEGYQAAPGVEEDQLREVDLQVQAIWSTLLHEWQLGYINPPPTYSEKLDSQRLRTPSTVHACRSGTCIDLALLFAACLELIDVYPVVFLLNGHALPGYWRHHDFQDEYAQVQGEAAQGALTANSESSLSGGLQRYAWQTAGPGAYREIRQRIRARQLVPIETVRLTEHCGFVEAVEAGVDALSEPGDFHSVLDIVTARMNRITPLPIIGGDS